LALFAHIFRPHNGPLNVELGEKGITMTLCIVWRDPHGIVHLAADSRVTVAKNSYEDVAIKVTRIPCQILTEGAKPLAGETSENGVMRIDLALAFAGSHICAYVVKETLVEILSRLHHIPDTTKSSMDQICKLAFYVYELLSKKVCSTSIGANGRCSLFIAGFCPEKKYVRVFRFDTNSQNEHSLSEILRPREANLVLIGSGASKALANENLLLHPLRALKDGINDPSQLDVGGSLQYGNIIDGRFEIFSEYVTHANGQPGYMRAAVDINDIISKQEFDDIFVSPTILDLNEFPPYPKGALWLDPNR
jgi:hypothetical protein